MTARALRAVPAPEEQRPTGFEALVRPEFRVDLYLPPRDNAWLYGPHCSVESCERPGNELIVDHARRLCQRHAQRFKQGRQEIDEFLATAPVIAARSELTGLPRYDLTSDSPVIRAELRLLMQALHDGAHSVTFSSKRWNALRAIYAASGAGSLLDVDLAAQPTHRVATGSAKRFKKYLAEVRDGLAGQEPSWRDDVWTRALYGSFVHTMQARPPVQMDFMAIRQPWLREAAKEIAWQRITVEGITPGVAWHMVQEVIRLGEWAGADRLRAPGDLTRALLVDWLIENKRSHPPRSVSQRLSWLRLFLNHARVLGLAISTDATYLPGELAIRAETEKPPRYFDDGELAQLDAPANQAKLGDYNRRAYQVLRHTAMRQRSLVHIPFDCLVEAGGASGRTACATRWARR